MILEPVVQGEGVEVVVVGAEDQGLTDAWINGADKKVGIPMLGKNDSLNVSTAAEIMLYEAVRQRRNNA